MYEEAAGFHLVSIVFISMQTLQEFEWSVQARVVYDLNVVRLLLH